MSLSVPSMVTEIVDSSLAGYPLDSLLSGGSAAQDQLPGKAKKAFPNTMMFGRISAPCGIKLTFITQESGLWYDRD